MIARRRPAATLLRSLHRLGSVKASGKAGASRPSSFVWSLVDQGLSSSTTLVLTAVSARSLGPSGLGTIVVGYAAFLIALGVVRSMVVDPLLTRIQSSARSSHAALSAALSTTLGVGVLVAIVGLGVGISVDGTIAFGLLIFSPWATAGLTHALLRSWLYRERRGAIAAASSGTWLVVMVAALAAGFTSSAWTIVAAWGLGACAAAAVVLVGAVETVRPAAPRQTFAWFVHEALGIGAWRLGSSIVFSVADYLRVVGLSGILGPAAVGGYRAIESIFAPISLVGPALTNSGLPPLRVAIEQALPTVKRLAVGLTLFSTVLIVAYVAVVFLAKDVLIGIFGDEFREYESLIPPVIAAQLLIAVGLGFALLLVAARRVRELALITTIHAGLMLAFVLPLAAMSGLEAAVWGYAAAEVVPLVLVMTFALRVIRGLSAASPSAQAAAGS